MSTTALHQQIRELLFEDPVIAACGFNYRTIGQETAGSRPHITVTWSDTWCESRSGLLGTVTIDVTGVDLRTRDAVLERVALVMQAAPSWSETIRRVQPDGYLGTTAVPNRFTVLATVADDPWVPSGTEARAEQARDLVYLTLAEDDALAAMGYRYESIRVHFTSDQPPEAAVDTLILTWAPPQVRPDGGTSQRVHLSVDGPSTRRSDDQLRDALAQARKTILAIDRDRIPIESVTVASPPIRRCIGRELLTVGFDVASS